MHPAPRLLCLPLLLTALLSGCSSQETYPSRPITLVCPWSTGGGTDRVSRQIAFFLEHELGVPVNVINATGGRGVTGHSRGLRARPDGYTIAMMTVELNMLHHQDLTSITYKDAEPLLSINEDAAALFVRADFPWTGAAELLEHIREHPGELTASGTAVGGIWHLALAGWLQHSGLKPTDVKWIPMNGAAPSLQELAGGGIDIVCCSLPEAKELYKPGREDNLLRCLGVMAEEPVPGYEEVPTLRRQGLDWTMVGWRGLAVPAGTPPERVETLVTAIEKIVTGRTRVPGKDQRGNPTELTFPAFMAREGFNNKWRKPQEFEQFLAENDKKFGALLRSEAFAGISTGKIGPMLYPGLLIGLIAVCLIALAVRSRLIQRGTVAERTTLEQTAFELAAVTPGGTPAGRINAFLVAAAVAAWPLLAETLGFVPLAAAILLLLLLRLGTRLIASLAVTALFVPAVYHVFAHFLRVPLPRGFLGW